MSSASAARVEREGLPPTECLCSPGGGFSRDWGGPVCPLRGTGLELVPDTLRRTFGLCLRAKGCILESNVTPSVCGAQQQEPQGPVWSL